MRPDVGRQLLDGLPASQAAPDGAPPGRCNRTSVPEPRRLRRRVPRRPRPEARPEPARDEEDGVLPRWGAAGSFLRSNGEGPAPLPGTVAPCR
ncbi:hypothetical protein DQ238_17905 [Geodermatophilus sp. TF02-6]|nr:hypothetical protein DQ238_17905 [Geodermatophilus sp. TF02-6]